MLENSWWGTKASDVNSLQNVESKSPELIAFCKKLTEGLNPFALLEATDPNCTLEDVLKIYKRLALVLHPDKFSTKSDQQQAGILFTILGAAKTFVETEIAHFLAALHQGLPDCSGVAVGFDRLMLL